MLGMPDRLRVALVRGTFFEGEASARLVATLDEARSQGAELAVLPELPLDPWMPATAECCGRGRTVAPSIQSGLS